MAIRRERDAPEFEALAILTGRAVPDARRLLDAIRRVNPTGLDLHASVAARRYDLKSRLQSLLVAHFRDDLSVALDPAEPGTVVLRHRGLAQHACHALMVALDENARAWVQLQLDLGPSAEAPSQTPVATRATRENSVGTDALAPAREALAAYDYELARSLLTAVVRNTPSSLEATLGLIELLVDTLADDHAALALEERIPEAVHQHPALRAALALAEARSGDTAHARQRIRGLEHARVSEVHLSLASRALSQDDLDAAAKSLEAARARDPSHTSLARVGDEIQRRRAERARPDEQAIQRTLDAGEHEAALAMAAELLERWPESALAQRVVRDARRLQREIVLANALVAVEQALSQGESVKAREALREAGRHGEVPKDLVRRVEIAEARSRREQGAREAAAVREAIARGALDEALALWSAAGDEGREAMREGHEPAALRWFDGIRARGRSIEARTGAVQALLDAEQALAEGALQTAIERLSAQWALLEEVSHARELMTELRRRADAAEARAGEEALSSCEAWVEDGALPQAREALERVTPRVLSLEQQARHRDLVARVARAEAVRALEAELAAHAQANALLAARQAAEALVAQTDGDARQRWEETRASLGAALRRQWGVEEVSVDPSAAAEPWETLEIAAGLMTRSGIWTAAGTCWMLDIAEREVFAQHCDLVRGRVLTRLRWVLPVIAASGHMNVCGDRMWVSAENVVELRRETSGWTPAAWWPLRAMIRGGERGARMRAFMDCSILWAKPMLASRQVDWEVIDLEQARTVRTVSGCANMSVTWLGPQEVGMGLDRVDRARVLDAHGRLLESVCVEASMRIADVGLHPRGEGVLVLASRAEDKEKTERGLFAAEWSNGMKVARGAIRLTRRWGSRSVYLCTATAQRAVYVLSDAQGGDELTCVAWESGGLKIRWQTALTTREGMLRPAPGGVVTLVIPCAEGARVWVLASDAPPGDLEVPTFDRSEPRSWEKLLCLYANARSTTAQTEVMQAIQRLPRTKFSAWVVERAATIQNPRALVDFFSAVVIVEMTTNLDLTAFGAVEALASRHGGDPTFALFRASLAAAEGRWPVCAEALDAVSLGSLSDEERAHGCHLRGLAYLHGGHRAAALEVFHMGVKLPHAQCRLWQCLSLAEPVGEPPTEDDMALTAPAVRQLVVRTIVADRCMARGQPREALEALEVPALRVLADIQGLARRAAAWLAIDAMSAHELYEKSRGLGRFVRCWTVRGGSPAPLPDNRWDDATLEALRLRAVAWLDADRQRRGVGNAPT